MQRRHLSTLTLPALIKETKSESLPSLANIPFISCSACADVLTLAEVLDINILSDVLDGSAYPDDIYNTWDKGYKQMLDFCYKFKLARERKTKLVDEKVCSLYVAQSKSVSEGSDRII